MSTPVTSPSRDGSMSVDVAISYWREKQALCEALEAMYPRGTRIENLRNDLTEYPEKKIDPTIKRELEHGWLMPYLLKWDLLTWQRWHYLEEIAVKGELPEKAIPKLELCFGNNGKDSVKTVGSPGRRHLEACLDLIPNSSGWKGWGSWSVFNYLLDWLLFGFGDPTQLEEPKEPVAGASMRLYQYFNLSYLVLFPWDYWGDLLSENRYGRESAFYPTPHCVAEAKAEMGFYDVVKEDCKDPRLTSFLEPCCGTGRSLIYASNYTLLLAGADINQTLVKTTMVNGYLYMPWLVRPVAIKNLTINNSNIKA